MFGIDDIITAGLKIIDKVIPDPTEKAKAQAQLMQLNHDELMAEFNANTQIAVAQIATNTEEAKSSSLLVSGWRPACGWVCASALGYHYLLQPLLVFVIYLFGGHITLPEFDMNSLLTILGGMLGLGGLRTFEKSKGVVAK